MKNFIKKSITALSIGAMVLSATSSVNAQEVSVKRIAGGNRVETAIEISKEAGSNRSTAIISSTKGSVDALASTLLASETGAVQLLSNPDSIGNNVKEQLKNLKVDKVYLIGGTSVLSKSIENELSKSYKVKRLAGKDRVETSIQIIEELSNVSDPNKLSDTFFIVNGYQGLADALSIGPVAGRDSNPILLTGKDKIPTKTIELINKKKPKEIIIIGGTSVVSPKVEKELEKYSKVDRIAGKNRGATSVAIARRYYINPEGAILANGQTFADALSGGYYAIEQGKPLLLLTNNSTNKEVNEYVKENNSHLTFLGGTNSISKSTEKVITVSANKPVDKPVDKPIDKPEEFTLDVTFITEEHDSTKQPDDWLPVQGIRYKVYNMATNKLVGEGLTDKNGQFVVEKLPEGDYKWKQTLIPEKYKSKPDYSFFSISNMDEEMTVYGLLQLKKVEGAPILDQDGNPVDIWGNRLDEDGNIIPEEKSEEKPEDKPEDKEAGRDENGNIIGADGKLYDDDGNLVNKDGHYIDEEGRLINSDGHLVDEEGRLIDENGNLY